MDVIEAMISIALHTVARWIWHQKEERGGWVPWLGGVLRGLIVADERQRYWTAPAFDIVEGQITSSLICPITVALVCVSLSFVPSQLQKAYFTFFFFDPTPIPYFFPRSVDPVVGPHGRVYERERLYLHLQISGCDPVSREPASALSYTRSPVAARLAKEVARRYGARLEPL